MSNRILEMARKDSIRFIGAEGDWGTELTFQPPVGDPFTIEGLATVHSQSFDENGLPIIADNSHILFSEKAVTDLGYATRENGKLVVKDWVVDFDHAVGHVKALLSVPEPDATLGLVRCRITNYEE